MTKLLNYRRNGSRYEIDGAAGRRDRSDKFIYYTNTIYHDTFDSDRYRVFIQNWLTSKSWNTSKLVNKFYILITNSLMSIYDKLASNPDFSNNQILPLHNFHQFSNFCT